MIHLRDHRGVPLRGVVAFSPFTYEVIQVDYPEWLCTFVGPILDITSAYRRWLRRSFGVEVGCDEIQPRHRFVPGLRMEVSEKPLFTDEDMTIRYLVG